jgi:hypothetical protein
MAKLDSSLEQIKKLYKAIEEGKPINTFDAISKLYKENAKKYELEDYKYIQSINDFSVLPLAGSLRYINKYTQEIRYGGLLIKI